MKEFINNKGKKYLFIQVPENINKFWVHFDSISNQTKIANDSANGWTTWQYVLSDVLNPKDYKIIATTKDITEEQCFEIVESKLLYSIGKGEQMWFINYNMGINVSSIGESKWKYKTSKESLQSLLTSLGLNNNKKYVIVLVK